MNPMILAGLVFTGIGLLQEAKDADGKPVRNVIEHKPEPVAETKPKVKKKAPVIEKPTDG